VSLWAILRRSFIGDKWTTLCARCRRVFVSSRPGDAAAPRRLRGTHAVIAPCCHSHRPILALTQWRSQAFRGKAGQGRLQTCSRCSAEQCRRDFYRPPFFDHRLLFCNCLIYTARRCASAVYAVVGCPSVRLSNAGIVSKRPNVDLRKQRHVIAPQRGAK